MKYVAANGESAWLRQSSGWATHHLLSGFLMFGRRRRRGLGTYRDKDLTYAARVRCLCGAGMAYGREDYWDCSAILKGEAVPSGQPGSVKHEAKLPFVFYEIQSEHQPSAKGDSTRP